MSHEVQIFSKKTERRKATFVVCQDCLWCMSCFCAENIFQACPSCRSKNIDSLPIFAEEYFNVEFTERRSIELSFRAQKDRAVKL